MGMLTSSLLGVRVWTWGKGSSARLGSELLPPWAAGQGAHGAGPNLR